MNTKSSYRPQIRVTSEAHNLLPFLTKQQRLETGTEPSITAYVSSLIFEAAKKKGIVQAEATTVAEGQ